MLKICKERVEAEPRSQFRGGFLTFISTATSGGEGLTFPRKSKSSYSGGSTLPNARTWSFRNLGSSVQLLVFCIHSIHPRLYDSEGGGFSTSQYARLGRDCKRSWRARFTNDSWRIIQDVFCVHVSSLNSTTWFLGILSWHPMGKSVMCCTCAVLLYVAV